MDSLTQLVLGAAVGHATLGRQVGRRALGWGAALGTLPDLDVLIPMGDAVADFTGHRGWTHSLVVLAAATPLCTWLATRVHPATRAHRRGWLLLVALVFLTHVVLDCFTVYGTQVLWPLPRAPESWSTIFVVDPAYTLPLLLGIAGAFFWHRRRPDRGRRVNAAGLWLSSLYLLWTVVAKVQVENVVADTLARQGVQDAQVLTTPTPFNSLLWRVVVMREDGYAEGYWSLLADDGEIELVHHPSEPHLLEGLRDHPPVARLLWFTHGFCSVARDGDRVVLTDLRMGSEPEYVFRFAVGRVGPSVLHPIVPEQLATQLDLSRLTQVWARIWDPTVPLGRSLR